MKLRWCAVDLVASGDPVTYCILLGINKIKTNPSDFCLKCQGKRLSYFFSESVHLRIDKKFFGKALTEDESLKQTRVEGCHKLWSLFLKQA